MGQTKPKIIVVGAGISGCMAALTALRDGAEVRIITVTGPARSSAAFAVDGIDAALDHEGLGDSPAAHAAESFAYGQAMGERAAIEAMCTAAPNLIALFERMGVLFFRNADGSISQRRGLGGAAKRTMSAGFRTGRSIISALDASLRRLQMEGKLVIDEGFEFLSPILSDSGRCRGVVAMNTESMEVKSFPADAVIICTGGYEGIFGAASSNPQGIGTAAFACFEQGALFSNPELIDFFPAAIELSQKRVPVGEAVIAAGGALRLLNDGKTHSFLDEKLFLGPQLPSKTNIIRQALSSWVSLPGAEKHELHLALDISGLDREWLGRNFSDLLSLCEIHHGRDPFEAPIPLAPVAATSLGGLRVNADHATSIEGLFSAGKVCALYHGAAALSGNGILSSAYGGMIAGRRGRQFAAALEGRSHEVQPSLLDAAKVREEDRNAHIAAEEGDENPHLLHREIASLMHEAAWIAREDAKLTQARERIAGIASRIKRSRMTDRSTWANGELLFLRRLERMSGMALMVIEAALARKQSIGMHFKPGAPEKNDSGLPPMTIARFSNGAAEIRCAE